MPVVFKIIWILLLIGTFFSLFGVFAAAKQGYMVLGQQLYGLWGANTMFAVSILFPVILLVAMYKRLSWAWIWGVILYLFMCVNELLMIGHLTETVDLIMAELPDFYYEMVPDLWQLVYYSAIAGVILGVLVNLFFILAFIIKRRYFRVPTMGK